jgi:hypothetical protein
VQNSFTGVHKWSSGQSSRLQIQRSGLDSGWILRSSGSGTGATQPCDYKFEELLERKSSGSGLESREYCRGDTSR